MSWTPELIDQLKVLWQTGLSTAEIGRRLGITKNAVVGKVHRLGLPNRESPIKRGVVDKRPRPPRPVAQPAVIAAYNPLHTCSWPIGHPREAGFRFCGAPAMPGKPYCAEHAAIAYVAARPTKRDRAA